MLKWTSENSTSSMRGLVLLCRNDDKNTKDLIACTNAKCVLRFIKNVSEYIIVHQKYEEYPRKNHYFVVQCVHYNYLTNISINLNNTNERPNIRSNNILSNKNNVNISILILKNNNLKFNI